MAYDAALAQRVRRIIAGAPQVTEKAMFGGLALLLSGKMFCGVVEDELMVRVGPDFYGEALSRPNVRPMDFTGRPMKGYIFVVAEGCRTARMTKPWVDRSLAFVKTLEPTKRWRTNRQRATKELRNPNPEDPGA